MEKNEKINVNEAKILESVVTIFKEEIVAAKGCTEPIAISYVAAKAADILEEIPDRLDVYVSGNIIKNVKSVIVPNSEGMVGIEASAGLGALLGDSKKELLVLNDIKSKDLDKVRKFIDEGRIKIFHEKGDIKLYIKIKAYSKDKNVSVEVKHVHTNITEIKKDGKTILFQPCNDSNFNSSLTDREVLSIELIYNLSKTIDLKIIEPIFNEVIKCNSAIADAGLRSEYGVNVGTTIMEAIKDGVYGDDQRNRSASFAAAGSDARMSGCALPVMTTSGSGNQGMTASLPIIKYCMDNNIEKEKLIRTLFFSHLATIHIKTNVGRLSAYCGAICATAGVSGGLTLLNDGTLEEVGDAITNTLANISGVICDGAKTSCAAKIASGIYTAFDSYLLAKHKRVHKCGVGIVGKDVEKTIKNIGILAQQGMNITDDVILKIMTEE